MSDFSPLVKLLCYCVEMRQNLFIEVITIVALAEIMKV